jgi:hypothetical protein
MRADIARFGCGLFSLKFLIPRKLCPNLLENGAQTQSRDQPSIMSHWLSQLSDPVHVCLNLLHQVVDINHQPPINHQPLVISPSDPVHVCLNLLRHVEIDHVLHIWKVQTLRETRQGSGRKRGQNTKTGIKIFQTPPSGANSRLGCMQPQSDLSNFPTRVRHCVTGNETDLGGDICGD